MKGYEKLEQHLIHQGKVVGFYEDIVKLQAAKLSHGIWSNIKGQQLLFLLQTKERSYL